MKSKNHNHWCSKWYVYVFVWVSKTNYSEVRFNPKPSGYEWQHVTFKYIPRDLWITVPQQLLVHSWWCLSSFFSIFVGWLELELKHCKIKCIIGIILDCSSEIKLNLSISVGSRISETGGGANPKSGGVMLLFDQICPEKGIKIKEIGSTGQVPGDPPMYFVNSSIFNIF